MKLLQCLLYHNDCFKANAYIKPTRIVVHSTASPNTRISRYVQPHKGQTTGMGGKTYDEMMKILGKNKYENDWNRGGIQACVHAFIGKLADGTLATVQTMPWTMRPWGAGKGKYGSFNDCAINFEICEDDDSSEIYCRETYNEAVELCAMLCKKYNIRPSMIVSHKEAHDMGFGSNHGDPDHWWGKFNLSMDKFRRAVSKKLNDSPALSLPYQVKVNADELNIRSGPGAGYKKTGCITDRGVYTITKVSNDHWGYLKSGKGWINLNYTEVFKK